MPEPHNTKALTAKELTVREGIRSEHFKKAVDSDRRAISRQKRVLGSAVKELEGVIHSKGIGLETEDGIVHWLLGTAKAALLNGISPQTAGAIAQCCRVASQVFENRRRSRKGASALAIRFSSQRANGLTESKEIRLENLSRADLRKLIQDFRDSGGDVGELVKDAPAEVREPTLDEEPIVMLPGPGTTRKEIDAEGREVEIVEDWDESAFMEGPGADEDAETERG